MILFFLLLTYISICSKEPCHRLPQAEERQRLHGAVGQDQPRPATQQLSLHEGRGLLHTRPPVILLLPVRGEQEIPEGDPQDGKRRGPQQADQLQPGLAGPHLPQSGQREGESEHGNPGNAAGQQDPRRSCPAVGLLYTEGQTGEEDCDNIKGFHF